MEHERKGIKYQSAKYEKLTCLINRVNEETLKQAHQRQKTGKAVGIDEETKESYGTNLEENVRDLVSFRPNRSAHDVVRYINQTVMTRKVNYVLEADIKGFFDNLDQKWLMKFLEHDIADKNFLRYVSRFLKAGIMEGTEKRESDRGTPQGGQISPVLANVYLHYVLDQWYDILLRKSCKGEVYYVRYADDFLFLFQYENEAKAVMQMSRERLGKFGLELAEDKTRILPIGRFKGTKEDFDFLGFTFYNTKPEEENIGWESERAGRSSKQRNR